jgi:hypothetical protein
MVSVSVPGRNLAKEGEVPPETVDQIEQAVKDEAIANATEEAAATGIPAPVLIPTSEVAVQSTAHQYIGPDGQPIPVATLGQEGRTKYSLNVPDVPPTPTPPGTLTVDGYQYTFFKAPHANDFSVLPTGPEGQDPLFHNIPGTPMNCVCLTEHGVEHMLADGFIDGTISGYSNGIPYYLLTQAALDQISGVVPVPPPL